MVVNADPAVFAFDVAVGRIHRVLGPGAVYLLIVLNGIEPVDRRCLNDAEYQESPLANKNSGRRSGVSPISDRHGGTAPHSRNRVLS